MKTHTEIENYLKHLEELRDDKLKTRNQCDVFMKQRSFDILQQANEIDMQIDLLNWVLNK